MQKNKQECKHYSFKQIYMLMNAKKIWRDWWVDFTCSKCWESCHASWKRDENNSKKTFIEKISWCLPWVVPPLLIILWLVYFYYCLATSGWVIEKWHIILAAFIAIDLVVIFHIVSMYYLSKSPKLIIKNK